MSMNGNYLPVTEEDLNKLLDDPDLLSDFLYEEKEEEIIEIDKAWHAIHYTLNERKWEGIEPLFNVVLGGEQISEEDIGYGPARSLLPKQVSEVSNALTKIEEKDFRAKFNSEELIKHDIYPQLWDDNIETLDYVSTFYNDVRSAFIKASDQKMAMILFLN
ncbi:YfbM family protein [Parashewanella spongiae]|nr:YfbM family protein [Parashewanella spongiae]MCL1080306.1 YfbM family protein [Parashewanella spongiae]